MEIQISKTKDVVIHLQLVLIHGILDLLYKYTVWQYHNRNDLNSIELTSGQCLRSYARYKPVNHCLDVNVLEHMCVCDSVISIYYLNKLYSSLEMSVVPICLFIMIHYHTQHLSNTYLLTQ